MIFASTQSGATVGYTLALSLVVASCGGGSEEPTPDAGAPIVYDDPLVVVSDLNGSEPLGIESLAIEGDRLYACSAAGLIVYDVADLAQPIELFRADVAGAGACQHLAFSGSVAFASHHGSPSSPTPTLAAYDVSGSSATLLDSVADGTPFEGITVSGDFVVAAKKSAGVASYSWDGTTFGPAATLSTGFINAWNVEPIADKLAIADAGFGLVMAVIDASGTITEESRVALDGSPQELVSDGQTIYIAAGVGGVHAVNATDLGLIGNTKTRTSAAQLAVVGGNLFVADWTDARVYDTTDPGNLVVLATERVVRDTVSGVRGIAAAGSTIFVGDWNAPLILEHRPERSAPDVWTANLSLDFGTIAAGNDDAVSLIIRNEGTEPLEIVDIEVSGTFAASRETLTVPAGQPAVVEVTFAPTDASPATGTITLHSADPDQPAFAVSLAGNAPQLAVGDPIPEVVIALLDGGEWRSSQQLGTPTLLVYFATF